MKIDETKMNKSPGGFQRVKYGILSGLWGLALSYVVMIFIPFLHFISVYDHPLYIVFIVSCTLLGFLYGERFIETLAVKTGDWFDKRDFFRF
ncbi:MAG: hypothetical protein WD357_12205 [Gracilimonas sp.]